MEKLRMLYEAPELVRIELDNEISLVLSTDNLPPVAPGENSGTNVNGWSESSVVEYF